LRTKPVLFEVYPGLAGKIPWKSLGDYPTPVQKLDKLGAKIGTTLFCKRDDLAHQEYGGNKIRKLEFLLADAERLGRKSVFTLGAWGSNHILATTVMSSKMGIKPLCVMVPQCKQEYARKNLLTNLALGCEVHYASGNAAAVFKTIAVYGGNWLRGSRPYFIWAGGSSALGCLGYVDAAFEIAAQVKQGILPEPDYMFCAVGSNGTFAGLALGMKLAGLKTKMIGIQVYDKISANSFFTCRLAKQALALMRKNDPKVPDLKLTSADFPVLYDYFGGAYARFTDAGLEAVSLAKDLEDIKLDGTYTGKTLAGVIDLARKGQLKDKVTVFLDSYNSRPLDKLVPVCPSWKDLPEEFHNCFEDDPKPEGAK